MRRLIRAERDADCLTVSAAALRRALMPASRISRRAGS
jgi:hypothetical protein